MYYYLQSPHNQLMSVFLFFNEVWSLSENVQNIENPNNLVTKETISLINMLYY